MSYRKQVTMLVLLILLGILTGCRGTIEVVYTCEGTFSGATVWYSSPEGTTTEEITLPWQQTVHLPEKSVVPELKVEVPDEKNEISCHIYTAGNTGSDSAPGPEIVVREANSGE